MITQYFFDGTMLRTCNLGERDSGKAPVWIDLLKPDDAEIATVDEKFSLNLPTLEKMKEIEISSRLYEENGAYYMTFLYITDALGQNPEASPFTFMLKDNLLVTIRYKDMRVISGFQDKAQSRGLAGHKSCGELVVLMLENIVDLCADALEKGHSEIEQENREIFNGSGKDKNFRNSLEQIAKTGDLNSKMRESLVSLNRLVIYLGHALKQMAAAKPTLTRIDALAADIQSLIDHAGFVSNKLSFMLDATLGMVNIEQNAIIKIFSVAAVIFLPPTLVASIYGMNFRHMPELDWDVGYPVALFLMVLSALLPYWYFKRKKWL